MRWWMAAIAAIALGICDVSGLAAAQKRSGQGKTEQLAESANALHAEVEQLYEAGKHDQAESIAKRALAMREKVLGPDHLDVAASLTILAVVYEALKRRAEAEPLYKRALAISEKADEDVQVGLALYYLAELY